MTGHHDVLRTLYSELLARVDVLVDRLVAVIWQHERRYQSSGSVPDWDLRRSCRDNIIAVLQILSHTVPPGMDPMSAPRATGARRAEQRLPLDAVLHSFRLGGRVIWEALAEHARRLGSAGTDAVVDEATSVWDVIDRMSSEVADSYRRTEQELVRADADRVRSVLETLLSGRGNEPGVAAQAAQVLGLPATGGFAVVAATVGADGGSNLKGAARWLAAERMASVWHPWPDCEIGVVALGGQGLSRLARVLRERFSGIRVGISAEVESLADVQQAHLQANTALATLPLDRPGVALLEDSLPAALVVSSPELAGRLVRAVLGPVLDLPPAERDLLLETARTWLDADGSPSATAAALYCHRNTVLNRLRRLEALAGYLVDSNASRVQLTLALTAMELLPTYPGVRARRSSMSSSAAT